MRQKSGKGKVYLGAHWKITQWKKEQNGPEAIKSLQKLVERKEKEKSVGVDELKEKEKLIHELKMKVGNDCVCQKI